MSGDISGPFYDYFKYIYCSESSEEPLSLLSMLDVFAGSLHQI